MPEAQPLTSGAEDRHRAVHLRYEDQWPELLAQLESDRAFGLADGVARRTILSLLDDRTFVEVGSLARREQQSYEGGDEELDTPPPMIDVPGDALVAGWGLVDERQVFVIADDVGLGGPIRGSGAAAKANRVREMALRQAKPLIEILAAARLAQGQFIGAEFGNFGYGVDFPFEFTSRAQIPRVALVSGRLTAQAAFEAAGAHFLVLIGSESRVSLFADDDNCENADYTVDTVSEAIALTRQFLAFLPENCWSSPPAPHSKSVSQEKTVASSSTDGSRQLALSVCDRGEIFELKKQTATGLLTGLAHVEGKSVGVVATDRLTPSGCAKVARFVRMCDVFRLPVIYIMGDTALPPAGIRGEALAARSEILNSKSPQAVLRWEAAPNHAGEGLVSFLGLLDGGVPGASSSRTLSYYEARTCVARALSGVVPKKTAPWQDPRVNRGRSRRRNPASG